MSLPTAVIVVIAVITVAVLALTETCTTKSVSAPPQDEADGNAE
jgi:hypothetical protein